MLRSLTLLAFISFVCFSSLNAQVAAETFETDDPDMNNMTMMNHSFMGTIGRNPYVPNAPYQNSWWSLINIRHRNGGADGNAWGTQITVGLTGYMDRMFFRGHANSVWLPWQEVYTAASPSVRINNAVDDGVSALQVNGNATAATFVAKQQAGPSGNVLFGLNNLQGISRAGIGYAGEEGGNNTGSNFTLYSYNDAGAFLRADLMISRATGNIGIGTYDPPERLSVNGTVLATKVRVKAAGAWPDYVFARNYRLPALSEIEKFITQYQHLPNMPTAAAIEKDGQDLGDMNRRLLEKVEELTLYIIDQQKQLTAQQKAQEAQQAEISRLRSIIENK